MLEYIGEILESLYNSIMSLFEFIGNMVQGFMSFLRYLPTTITMLTSSIGNLPDIILPFATASITIAVVLLVIGRQNQT